MLKAEFGMDVLRVTQGPQSSYSHKGREAVDFGGAYYSGSGIREPWYARGCDWRVMEVQAGGDHFVYFETTEPVLRPNGTTGHVTLALCHQDTVTHKVGQVIRDGELLYTEGTYSGGRKGGTDIHMHCQVGDGKFAGPYMNKANNYRLPNEAKVQDMLFVPDNVTVANGAGLSWKRDDGSYTTQAEAEEINKLRVLQVGVAKESLAEAMEQAVKAVEAGNAVAVVATSGGDRKNRLAYSCVAREYTKETGSEVAAALLAGMGTDAILLTNDGNTRLYRLDSGAKSHSEVVNKMAAPFCVASPNAAGRGNTWAVGTSIRALEGNTAAQYKALEEYAQEAGLLPGDYVIG